MRITKFRSIYKSLFFYALLGWVSIQQLYAQEGLSQQTEVVGGKTFIVHKVAPKETYYQLSRIYGVPVNEIIQANNKKSLKIGDIVRIPAKENATSVMSQPVAQPVLQANVPESGSIYGNVDALTEYKVGKSETLFAIARRFDLTVEDIKKFNNLTSDSVREGQMLKIPETPLPAPEPPAPVIEDPIILPAARSTTVNAETFKSTRHGIRETSEKGVGIWMENLETKNNTNLALHRTAPVGTVLKITNPINNSITYAKVVGKFADNSETQDAIVVLSRSAASYVGAVDKRFLVEITYGLPLE